MSKNIETDKLKNEKNFINLLFNHKQLVQDWIDSPLDISYFDDNHKYILKCIKYCYSNDVMITKRNYSQFIKKSFRSK